MTALAQNRDRKPMRPDTMCDGVGKKRSLRLPLKSQFAPLKRNGAPKGLAQNRIGVGVAHLQIAHDPGSRISQTYVRAALRVGRARSQFGRMVDDMIDTQEVAQLDNDPINVRGVFDY